MTLTIQLIRLGSRLLSGVYLIEATQGDQRKVLKVIKSQQ
jgi:hypothetical protein